MDLSSIEEYEEEPRQGANFVSGSEGIWTFVFIDMVIFALIFFVYTTQRVQQYQLYEASHHQLNIVFGFVNTLILLGSSLFVVRAVRAARRGDSEKVSSQLARALLLGVIFCVDKGVEYYGKIESGIGVTTNSFFTFYFFITFLHLLHVLAGMSFIYVFKRSRGQLYSNRGYVTGLENVGLFWHFVDLLWIFIYALLYLL